MWACHSFGSCGLPQRMKGEQSIQSIHACFVRATLVKQESVTSMTFLKNWKNGIDSLDPTKRHDRAKL